VIEYSNAILLTETASNNNNNVYNFFTWAITNIIIYNAFFDVFGFLLVYQIVLSLFCLQALKYTF